MSAQICYTSILALAVLAAPPAAPQSPSRYEISINGENFEVPIDTAVEVKSTAHPGTTYRLAVRLAQYQPYRLNTLKFDYHLGFTVSDDAKPATRTATLNHSLGFVVSITDLGGPLTAARQEELLKLLVDSAKSSLRGEGDAEPTASAASRRKAGQAELRGVTIRAAGTSDQCALAYLITGERFSATCTVRCSDKDRTNVMSIVKPILDSFAPLPSEK